MRAEHIKYFIALAENHSITKTALEYYTTHQSVSKVIRQLEDEMGAELFVRSPKGMQLTPEGELFLPIARETVKKFQNLRLEFAHMHRQHEMEGLLPILGTPIANAVAMRALIENFSVLYPKVRYKISEANAIDIMHYISLHHNALGMVAVMHNEDYRDIYKPYINQVALYPLIKDEYICVVGAHSPLVGKKNVPIAEFIQHPLAMYQTDLQKDEHPFTQLLRRMGNVEPALSTGSRYLYAHSISQGQYVGISSRLLSKESPFSSESGLFLIPFEENMTLDIMLVTNAQPKFDAIGQAFWDLARERAGMDDA